MHTQGLRLKSSFSIACTAALLAPLGCGSSDQAAAPKDGGNAGSNSDTGAPGSGGSKGSGGTTGNGGSGGSAGRTGGGGTPASGGQSPTDASSDAPSTDAQSNGDGGESTTAVNLGSTSGGLLVGAASSDGSAMLIILTPSGLLWSHYEIASGWSVPANLPGGANADIPQVGIDAAGNTFVAWTCSADGGRTLCVSRYAHASGSWENVQTPDDYTQFSSGFALSVAPSGEALAIYLHNGSPGPHDVVAQHYSGGSWAPELILAEANSTNVSTPVVAMAAGGLAVAAFNSATGLNVATRSGSSWKVASSTLPAAEFGLSATVNDAGDVLVGFMDSTTFPNTYQYDATAKTWNGPTARSSAGESSAYGQCPLTVALSTTGDGILARCFSSVPRTIESYSYTKSGNSWGSAAALPSSGWPFIVSFAFDAAGDGFAAWTNSPNSSYQTAPAVLSTFSKSSGWSPESAPLGGTVTANPLAAFVSPDGRGWVAWNEGTSAVVKRAR